MSASHKSRKIVCILLFLGVVVRCCGWGMFLKVLGKGNAERVKRTQPLRRTAGPLVTRRQCFWNEWLVRLVCCAVLCWFLTGVFKCLEFTFQVHTWNEPSRASCLYNSDVQRSCVRAVLSAAQQRPSARVQQTHAVLYQAPLPDVYWIGRLCAQMSLEKCYKYCVSQ